MRWKDLRESKKESIINEKEAAVKKNEEVKTVVWVFWILLAIIGVSMLFAGIQGSIQGNNIATCVMLIVVGIILLFIGLVMVLGRANIITNDIEMPKSSKNEEKK